MLAGAVECETSNLRSLRKRTWYRMSQKSPKEKKNKQPPLTDLNLEPLYLKSVLQGICWLKKQSWDT